MKAYDLLIIRMNEEIEKLKQRNESLETIISGLILVCDEILLAVEEKDRDQ